MDPDLQSHLRDLADGMDEDESQTADIWLQIPSINILYSLMTATSDIQL